MATISDKKLPDEQSPFCNPVTDMCTTYVVNYNADIVTANDYYPFGMVMPGRKYSQTNSNYRYGFNGKENDNEVKGEGGQQDYGMRIYDPRLGRFLSVDPLTNLYPFNSTYAFAENDPINYIDLDGGEKNKPPLDYYAKAQILQVGMFNTSEKILFYKGMLSVTKDAKTKQLINSQIATLQNNYQGAMIWLYKNRTNIELDRLLRVRDQNIAMLGTTLVVGYTVMSAYGGIVTAGLIVDGFEAGGLTGGMSVLATEVVQYIAMDKLGLPVPFKVRIGAGFGGAYSGASINFLKGRLGQFFKEGTGITKTISKLNKTIKNLNKTIDEHIDKINDPKKVFAKKGNDWDKLSKTQQEFYIKGWQEDIKRNQAYRNTVQEYVNGLEKLVNK